LWFTNKQRLWRFYPVAACSDCLQQADMQHDAVAVQLQEVVIALKEGTI
jgi:hypothetical protein